MTALLPTDPQSLLDVTGDVTVQKQTRARLLHNERSKRHRYRQKTNQICQDKTVLQDVTFQKVIRGCTVCKRPLKGHRKPTGKGCTMTALLPTDPQSLLDVTRDVTVQKQTHAKLLRSQRNKRYRDRQTTNAQKRYLGWTNIIPESTAECTKVIPLQVPKMTKVCCQCGAGMFPFEKHRGDLDGINSNSTGRASFSLCCNYGR